MSKVLKNTTLSAITILDTGAKIFPSINYTIPPQDYALWAASINIIAPVTAGSIVVNDGIRDLSVADGLAFLAGPEGARGVRFSAPPDRTNQYSSRNIQEALEEIDFREETKEPTGFVNTKYDSVVSFNESSLVFSISPVSGSFRYFIQGKEYIKTTTETVPISNTDGLWYIYYSGATLTASLIPWEFDASVAFVHLIYWNVADQKATLINEERHGLVMDWATHRHEHYTEGLDVQRYKFDAYNYILRGDGSLNTHAQIGYQNLGMVFDEDIDFTPINSATPANPYEQIISPYLYAPVLYRKGAGGAWSKLAATAYPLAWQAGNLARYNQWTGATWQLTTCTEGYFVNSYICLIEDSRNPFIIILGQNQHQTVVSAAGELFKDLIPNLPSPEVFPLAKLLFKTSASFTNVPKSVLYGVLPIGETVVDNDRYTVEMGTNGNAGVGKYLERSSGAGSNDNPFYFPESSFVRYVFVQAQVGSLNTVTIGLFNVTNLVTPILTVSLANQTEALFTFSQYFVPGDKVAWRVTSGSINKPLISMWVQTQIG